MKKSTIRALLIELAKDYGIAVEDIPINRKTVDFKPSIEDAALYFGSNLPSDFHRTDKRHILFCRESYYASSDDKAKKGRYYSGTLRATPKYYTIVCTYAELYDYIHTVNKSVVSNLLTPQPPAEWEPKQGSFYITGNGSIYDDPSPDHIHFGTSRKDKESCLKDLPAVRAHNRLLAYVAEFDPEFVENFNLPSHNWTVCKIVNKNKWQVNRFDVIKYPGMVFMSREVAQDLCRKLNSGEVVL